MCDPMGLFCLALVAFFLSPVSFEKKKLVLLNFE